MKKGEEEEEKEEFLVQTTMQRKKKYCLSDPMAKIHNKNEHEFLHELTQCRFNLFLRACDDFEMIKSEIMRKYK